jgi:transposase-like protein
LVFEKEELKKLIKEKKLKTLNDFNDFMRQISKEVLEGLLDGEMTDLLGYKKHDQEAKKTDNARNGFSPKAVNSKFGKIDLEVPRDRQADFDPIVVKKRQKDISGLEEKIISMYAKGMTTRDIQAHIHDIYGYELSPETISTMTDRIMDKAREWQNRPLQPIYSVVFMDALFLKMRCEGQVRNVAIYSILGIDLEGQKECLGLWICETESAKYWISVLNELKNRGIEDVLIFAVDGLSGLSDALQAAFPQAEVQRCIVHQIRNSLRYVSWKERKAMARDLKGIYKAASEKEALAALDDFEKAWNKKYPHVAASWRRNWAELATYFKYPQPIRTLIYTTNPIESMNRGLKKVTKNRAIFPNEDALFKLLYLAIGDISKKWTARVRDWAAIYPQLLIFFDQRLHKYINK